MNGADDHVGDGVEPSEPPPSQRQSGRGVVIALAVVSVVAVIAAVALGVLAMQTSSDNDDLEARISAAEQDRDVAQEALAAEEEARDDAESRADSAEEELNDIAGFFAEQMALGIATEVPDLSEADTQCLADELIESFGLSNILGSLDQFSSGTLPPEMISAAVDAFVACGVDVPV